MTFEMQSSEAASSSVDMTVHLTCVFLLLSVAPLLRLKYVYVMVTVSFACAAQ